MFHRGCLSLTLVQNFYPKFCKKNESLVNWNEIKDLFISHLDPGGYQWPPTFSDWLKTVFWQFWQFTIFSRF
jgi:hypothetical protein